MSKAKITEEELFAEMDKLRYNEPAPLLSDEEFQAIHYARGGNKPVPWSKLIIWWVNRGHHDLTASGIKKRYEKECLRRGVEANIQYK